MPQEPLKLGQFQMEPSLPIDSMRVVSPANPGIATKCILPSSIETPAPPCRAYCGGPPAAAAVGAAAKTARALKIAKVFMPRVRGGRPERSLDLDQEGVSLPAAGADRGQPEPAAVAAQLVDHGADDAAAARADRMTERDRAAVHVHGLRIGAEQLHGVEGDRRERLVTPAAR